jgi:predicted outer membrane repeat protein
VRLVCSNVAERIVHTLEEKYQSKDPARDHNEGVDERNTCVDNGGAIQSKRVITLHTGKVFQQDGHLVKVVRDARVDVDEEQNKGLVVAPPDTIVDPITMVIISIDTRITTPAVMCPWGLAQPAVFAHIVTVHRPFQHGPRVAQACLVKGPQRQEREHSCDK